MHALKQDTAIPVLLTEVELKEIAARFPDRVDLLRRINHALSTLAQNVVPLRAERRSESRTNYLLWSDSFTLDCLDGLCFAYKTRKLDFEEACASGISVSDEFTRLKPIIRSFAPHVELSGWSDQIDADMIV